MNIHNNCFLSRVLTSLADLAVFEPGAKHTYDSAAGKNVANPTAALLASSKMLSVRFSPPLFSFSSSSSPPQRRF